MPHAPQCWRSVLVFTSQPSVGSVLQSRKPAVDGGKEVTQQTPASEAAAWLGLRHPARCCLSSPLHQGDLQCLKPAGCVQSVPLVSGHQVSQDWLRSPSTLRRSQCEPPDRQQPGAPTCGAGAAELAAALVRARLVQVSIALLDATSSVATPAHVSSGAQSNAGSPPQSTCCATCVLRSSTADLALQPSCPALCAAELCLANIIKLTSSTGRFRCRCCRWRTGRSCSSCLLGCGRCWPPHRSRCLQGGGAAGCSACKEAEQLGDCCMYAPAPCSSECAVYTWRMPAVGCFWWRWWPIRRMQLQCIRVTHREGRHTQAGQGTCTGPGWCRRSRHSHPRCTGCPLELQVAAWRTHHQRWVSA